MDFRIDYGAVPAVLRDGTLFVDNRDNKLSIISGDGVLKKTLDIELPFMTSPRSGSSGTFHVGCRDGYLYTMNRG